MESVPRQIHFIWLGCHFQRLKQAHALSEIWGAYSTCLPCQEEFFQPFMSKAANHI